MENPAQRREECPETQIRMCVADQCSCISPETGLTQAVRVGGVTQSAAVRCQLTITYPESNPTLPHLYFDGGACSVSAEIALAVALAYFLKGSAPTVIP